MKYKFKTKPYDHQLTALEKSVDEKEYGYFMEMGTGKSKVLVDNMAMLYDKGKINGAHQKVYIETGIHKKYQII